MREKLIKTERKLLDNEEESRIVQVNFQIKTVLPMQLT